MNMNILSGDEFKKPSAWRGLETKIPYLLEDIKPISMIVEIGVDYGYSLFCLSKIYPCAEVIGIDAFGWVDEDGRDHGDAEMWVEKHLGGYPHIRLIKKTSAEARTSFNYAIDILHIDADHQYASVKRDFNLFEPLVRPGGCVLFHDIVSYPEDVGKFFEEIKGGKKQKILEYNGLGVWYKI